MILSSLLQRAAAASLPGTPVHESLPPNDGGLHGGPAPQLYSEAQLCLPETMGRPAEASGIVGDLLDAGSSEARVRLVRGMLHAIGFEWLG